MYKWFEGIVGIVGIHSCIATSLFLIQPGLLVKPLTLRTETNLIKLINNCIFQRSFLVCPSDYIYFLSSLDDWTRIGSKNSIMALTIFPSTFGRDMNRTIELSIVSRFRYPLDEGRAKSGPQSDSGPLRPFVRHAVLFFLDKLAIFCIIILLFVLYLLKTMAHRNENCFETARGQNKLPTPALDWTFILKLFE